MTDEEFVKLVYPSAVVEVREKTLATGLLGTHQVVALGHAFPKWGSEQCAWSAAAKEIRRRGESDEHIKAMAEIESSGRTSSSASPDASFFAILIVTALSFIFAFGSFLGSCHLAKRIGSLQKQLDEQNAAKAK